MEDKTVVLISTVAVGDRSAARAFAGRQSLPVVFENEVFSLINGIYAQMNTDDRFRPLSSFICVPAIICWWRIIAGVLTHRIIFLILMRRYWPVAGPMIWPAIFGKKRIRVSNRSNRPLPFGRNRDFPRPDKAFLVSEYKEIDNFTALLYERFGTTRVVVYDAMEDVDVPTEYVKYVDYFDNPSVFTTVIGLANSDTECRASADNQHKKLTMNFLEDAPPFGATDNWPH